MHKSIITIKLQILLVLIGISVGSSVYAQHERGRLPLQNFTPKDYESLPQNWDVTQDQRGVIYVANNQGLLEYKGEKSGVEKWSLFEVENGSNIRAVSINNKGYIYVGAHDEFGYFAPDSARRGKLTYYNLTEQLDSIDLGFGDVWHVVTTLDGVYFCSNKQVFFWDYSNIHVLNLEGNRTLFHFRNKVYVANHSKGLCELKGTQIHTLRGGHSLLHQDVDGKTRADFLDFAPYDNNSGLFVSTRYELKRIVFGDGSVEIHPFKTNFDPYIKTHRALRIDQVKEYFALSYDGSGVHIFDKKGRLVRVLNENTGLQNNKVRKVYIDDQDYLWVATNDGISRLQINSLYEEFLQKKSGFEGQVEQMIRFNGQMYLATSKGLFTLDKDIGPMNGSNYTEAEITRFETSAFTRLDHELLNDDVWGLAVIHTKDKHVLLASTNTSIVEIDTKGDVALVHPSGPWCFHVDKKDPANIYLGLYQRGLGRIYWTGAEWINERIGELNIDIRNIGQDDEGNLWLGAFNSTHFVQAPRFDSEHKVVDPLIESYNSAHGLPRDDAIYVKNIEGTMLFATGEGVYTFQRDSNRFVRIPEMGSWFNNGKHLVHRLASDHKQNLWSVVFSENKKLAFVTKTKWATKADTMRTYKPFVDEGELIHALYPDGEFIWLAGTNSVFKLKADIPLNDETPFRCYINFVKSNEDTIYNGLSYNDSGVVISQQSSLLMPTVSYEMNTFTFNFSSIGFNNEAPLRYSWYLEGYEDDWGSWSDKNEVRYTNLHEGSYSFHVRTKDVFSNISQTSVYTFTIKPPWYRTIWAYIGYVLFFAAFVWGAVTISTRSLRRIIREATAEIRAQKDELEEKNKNILDSIRYAQRIQEAVLPSESKLKRHFPEHFVFFKPRDIVSGDFYWMMNKGNKNIIVAADCTGHGVPGAFMSIMGVSFLNEIANNKSVQTAAEALNQLRFNVINSLNQDDNEEKAKDGMDLSLCVYDFENMTMEFAGAYNHLYRVRDGEFDTIKADRMPVGVHSRDNKPFTNQVLNLQKGDIYYILSDGYIDQFGGPDGKKYMTKRFKQLILDIHHKPMNEQQQILEEENLKWRGDIEQLDDIIVIGIKVV